METLIQKIRFFGDFTTGENYQAKYDNTCKSNILRQYGYDYLLKDVKSIFKNSYNIVNLETPITNALKSDLEYKKAVLHWSDPVIMPEFLKKYNISAVTLGNNHCYDYKEEGLAQTIGYLDKVNIKHTGAGLNIEQAKSPIVQSFNANEKNFNLYVFGGFKYKKEYQEEFNFYANKNKAGAYLLNADDLRCDIEKIKNEDDRSIVVIFPHYGFDLLKTVQDQIEISHKFIDYGADFVIGHGPHFMNKIEYYKNSLIVYSLGNFLFPADFKGKIANYDLVLDMNVYDVDDELKVKLKLYPIYNNNNSMNSTPRFIYESELNEVAKRLTEDDQEAFARISALRDDEGRICIRL